MKPNTTPTTRDEVLFAFHQTYERPTAEQIIEWTRRYPEFAEDIRAHAAVARDWAALEGKPVEPADETLLARGFSRVLDKLYNAQLDATPSAAVPAQPPVSFHNAMTACGKNVPALARSLDIERGVIADLFSGRMLAPVALRFKNAVAAELSISPEVFEQAHLAALATPRMSGYAKAEQAPTVIARSYPEIIRDSAMSDERKRYWLGED